MGASIGTWEAREGHLRKRRWCLLSNYYFIFVLFQSEEELVVSV